MKKRTKKQPANPRRRRGTNNKEYVIGVDGGGTKTVAALASLKGKILKLAKTKPSNLRNLGIEKAAENITLGIKKILPKKGEILSTFIGLAAVEEEYRAKKQIIQRAILKQKGISKILKGKLKIGSDQLVAFRAGSDERNGVVLISGTGCVAHGWKDKKEAKASGWGWLNDEGSGFWAGQRGIQAVLKQLDGRGSETKIAKLLFKKWNVKNKEALLRKVYSQDPIRQVSSISKIADKASEMGDKIAISIMKEAGRELVRGPTSVIKKIGLRNKKFPLVLIGGMFKSKIVLREVRLGIKKIAPQVQFIKPKNDSVIGAVKLAIENLK